MIARHGTFRRTNESTRGPSRNRMGVIVVQREVSIARDHSHRARPPSCVVSVRTMVGVGPARSRRCGCRPERAVPEPFEVVRKKCSATSHPLHRIRKAVAVRGPAGRSRSLERACCPTPRPEERESAMRRGTGIALPESGGMPQFQAVVLRLEAGDEKRIVCTRCPVVLWMRAVKRGASEPALPELFRDHNESPRARTPERMSSAECPDGSGGRPSPSSITKSTRIPARSQSSWSINV